MQHQINESDAVQEPRDDSGRTPFLFGRVFGQFFGHRQDQETGKDSVSVRDIERDL